jgi:hypothetical protein
MRRWIVLFSLCCRQVSSFGGVVVPQPFVVAKATAASFLSPSILLSDQGGDAVTTAGKAAQSAAGAATAAAAAIQQSGIELNLDALDDAGDIVINIAYALTAIVFIFAGLTVVTASVILPAAAKELEQECKELAPGLWEEYTALLKDGESISNRADLMQELGVKLQPLIDAKVEAQFASAKEKGIDVSQDEAAWRALDPKKKPYMKRKKTAAAAAAASSSQWDDD